MTILVFSPNGIYTTKTTLSAANTASDAAGKRVKPTGSITMTSNITLATDRQWDFTDVVITTTGYTLTCTGADIKFPDNKQVFAGSGTIAGLKEPNVACFGADGVYNNGDDSAAFLAAINALPASGGIVKIPSGDYNISISPTKCNVILQGGGVKTTRIFNNTSTPEEYAINWILGAQATDKLPMSVSIRDLTVVGDRANNYHGIRLSDLKTGGLSNVEFIGLGHGLYLNNCFATKHEQLFFRDYGIGILGNASTVSNDNAFDTIQFFGGNTDNNAVPINDTGINQSVFNNVVFEGSGQMGSTDLTHGNNNTFINPRWESCTPDGTGDPYVKLGGVGNKLINPLVTLLEVEKLTTNYLVEVSGSQCEIDGLGFSVPDKTIKLTSAADNCKIRLDTSNIPNQTIGHLFADYGTNNLININNADYLYNNEMSWSTIPIENGFAESIDFSAITADGVTMATVTGANSRLGPFKEGLIQGFTAITGNRKWTQNLATKYTTPSSNQVVAFSVWLKSLTVGGEDMVFQMGRAASLTNVATINIPDDKFIRVTVLQKADTAAYTDYTVGIVAANASSGYHAYGAQVVFVGTMTGGILPALYSGGYVPTAAETTKDVAPNYPVDRKHKAVPANGTGYVGARVGNVKPTVGQPKGWQCTVTGSPGTWVSEGDL